MGLKIVLDTTFTDITLPELLPDSLMNAGSLFLIDLGRSETSPLGSAPAHNGKLLNLAWEKAAAQIGSGTEDTLAGKWENSLIGQPTMGLVERTAKYGLHVIASQTANDGSNRCGAIVIPQPIIDRILAQLNGSQFYVSLWGRQTRVATAGTNSIGYIGASGSAANYAFNFFTQPAYGPPSGTALVGHQETPLSNVTGNFFRAIAFDEFTGTKPGVGVGVGAAWFGQRGVYAAFQQNGAASGIFYRMYIEDLSVSGRSYADTVAADRALYDIAVGTGGRFNADTFTAPSTIP